MVWRRPRAVIAMLGCAVVSVGACAAGGGAKSDESGSAQVGATASDGSSVETAAQLLERAVAGSALKREGRGDTGAVERPSGVPESTAEMSGWTERAGRSGAGAVAVVAPATTVEAGGVPGVLASSVPAVQSEPSVPSGADAGREEVRIKRTSEDVVPVVAPAVVVSSGGMPDASAVGTPAGVPVASGGFRIAAFAVCSRIEGFGKFTRLDSVAARSRSQPVLLYTQVDGFAHRVLGQMGHGVDESSVDWEVVIGQSVAVFRLGKTGQDDLLVRSEPEQISRDVLRGKRRDHYLVQRIELPGVLSGERYRVKVTVSDKVSGRVDERVTDLWVR